MSSSISSANREVQNLLIDENLGYKWGQYPKYSDDDRVNVAKWAFEMGVTNLLWFVKKNDGNKCTSLLEISP